MRAFILQKKVIIIGAIVLLAFIVRFYRIDQIPVSLYWDEAAALYNAYSIAYTLKDEYGTFLPLLFRSFEDYKMSGNIYLTAFFVRIFGMNEFSERVSSALLGTLTVLVTYFLVKELLRLIGQKQFVYIFPRVKLPSLEVSRCSFLIASLTSFLMAISPWHIQFSRTGFEANTAFFFIIAGIYSLLLSFRKSYTFIISMILFAVSVYHYRSVHLFLPLLLLSAFIIFRREFFLVPRKTLIIGSTVFILLILPLIPWMTSEGGLKRFEQVNVITNSQDKVYESAIKIEELGNDPLDRVVYNRRFIYVQETLKGYFFHFTPAFLFINGDPNGRHGPRGMGLLYLWELPFLLIGLVLLLRIPGKIKYFLIAWILVAPLPASISTPSPHALRSLNILPLPQLITAMGIVYLFLLTHKNYKKLFVVLFSFVIILSFFRYLGLYYNETARITSSEWADGHKQLTQYVFANEKKYDKILISAHYWKPHIYFLVYKKYDPVRYQKNWSEKRIDNYVFGGTSWGNEKELGEVNLKQYAGADNILVALSPQEYDKQRDAVRKLTEIKNHNDEVVFIVGEAL